MLLLRAILITLAAASLGIAGDTKTPIPSIQRAEVSWRYDVQCDPGTERFMLICTLPRTLPGRQAVKSLHISPEPSSRFVEGETEYARFDIRRPPPNLQIAINAEVELSRADLQTSTTRPAETQPHESDNAWLKPERYIESDNPAVIALAQSIRPRDGSAALQAIARVVAKQLQPGAYSPIDRGAAWALQNRRGDCSEYSDLFVALCRACGIPARAVDGYVITPVKDGDTSAHAWAEAYLPDVGWVPFDPFHTALGFATIEELSPVRIVTSLRRNDPNLLGLHNWAYRVWGKPATVRDHFVVKCVDVVERGNQ